jgi:hypothetical protein
MTDGLTWYRNSREKPPDATETDWDVIFIYIDQNMRLYLLRLI